MTQDDGYLSETRRSFMQKMAATGSMASLAGCGGSGNGSGSGQEADPTTTASPTATETPTSSGTETPTEGTTGTSGTSKDSAPGDQVLSGEKKVEQFYNRRGYDWFEMEHPTEQITGLEQDNSVPIIRDGWSQAFLEDIDAFYWAIKPKGGGYNLQSVGINSDKFQMENGNYKGVIYGPKGDYSEETVKTFFDDHVQGYDDISEDFPSELEALIAE